MEEEIEQRHGKLISNSDKKRILKDHPQLIYCGDCPFLLIKPQYTGVYDDVDINNEQENKCLLMESPDLWQINKKGVYIKSLRDYDNNWLKDGPNPKRNNQCLDFVCFIHHQLANPDFNK